MKITIITVGKIKEKYLKEGILEYSKRLSKYTKLEIIEVPDEHAPENLSIKDIEIIKDKEGNKILSKLKDSYIIALTIDGKPLSSIELANKIEDIKTYHSSNITFIIGGSLGLSNEVVRKANFKLSFSSMTFPHQLMRLILLEQIYRSFRINSNEPYHK
jgi:23S rRNA (pseudouridine1915-N3)-methyltransferase